MSPRRLTETKAKIKNVKNRSCFFHPLLPKTIPFSTPSSASVCVCVCTSMIGHCCKLFLLCLPQTLTHTNLHVYSSPFALELKKTPQNNSCNLLNDCYKYTGATLCTCCFMPYAHTRITEDSCIYSENSASMLVGKSYLH